MTAWRVVFTRQAQKDAKKLAVSSFQLIVHIRHLIRHFDCSSAKIDKCRIRVLSSI